MPNPSRRGAIGLGVTAVAATFNGQNVAAADLPIATAPASSQPVLVTIRLVAKDVAVLTSQLKRTLPDTRLASGCRYSYTCASPTDPADILMVQGWDSIEHQRAYGVWRKSTGDLQEFLSLLAKPPVLEIFNLVDA